MYKTYKILAVLLVFAVLVTGEVAQAQTAAPTANLTVSAYTVALGQSVTVGWTSTNASYCRLGSSAGQDLSTSGSFAVTPNTTTSYIVFCYGTDGRTASASATVIVGGTPSAPPSSTPSGVTLTADRATITRGESTTLRWSSNVAVSYCVGNGFAAGSFFGSASVSPTVTTTYTITCYGMPTSLGSLAYPASVRVTVNVPGAPPANTGPMGPGYNNTTVQASDITRRRDAFMARTTGGMSAAEVLEMNCLVEQNPYRVGDYAPAGWTEGTNDCRNIPPPGTGTVGGSMGTFSVSLPSGVMNVAPGSTHSYSATYTWNNTPPAGYTAETTWQWSLQMIDERVQEAVGAEHQTMATQYTVTAGRSGALTSSPQTVTQRYTIPSLDDPVFRERRQRELRIHAQELIEGHPDDEMIVSDTAAGITVRYREGGDDDNFRTVFLPFPGSNRFELCVTGGTTFTRRATGSIAQFQGPGARRCTIITTSPGGSTGSGSETPGSGGWGTTGGGGGGTTGGSGTTGGGGTGSPITRNLSYGSRGADVITLQTMLRNCGYLSGPADGRFGTMTFEAVKRFQAANGISVTGYVGTLTRRALANGACSGQRANPPGTPPAARPGTPPATPPAATPGAFGPTYNSTPLGASEITRRRDELIRSGTRTAAEVRELDWLIRQNPFPVGTYTPAGWSEGQNSNPSSLPPTTGYDETGYYTGTGNYGPGGAGGNWRPPGFEDWQPGQ